MLWQSVAMHRWQGCKRSEKRAEEVTMDDAAMCGDVHVAGR
jgi:hypothetical protein